MQLEENVLERVVQGFHIPPKPEILEKVQTLAQTPNVDPADVGRCIATDVGLSASILKTLNSPFYGMARTITDVTQATVLLGINSVLNLVAAIKIKESMHGDSCISLERFWDSASDISNAMTFIGKKAKLIGTSTTLAAIWLPAAKATGLIDPKYCLVKFAPIP